LLASERFSKGSLITSKPCRLATSQNRASAAPQGQQLRPSTATIAGELQCSPELFQLSVAADE